MNKRKIHLFRAFVFGFCILSADQLLKIFVTKNPSFSVSIIPPFFGLELFLNPGVAFGIPIKNSLVIWITPFALLWFSLFLIKKYKEPKTNSIIFYGVAFIIFGATSNFIDRIFNSYTIDYIRIIYSVFNLADISIVVGVILLLFGDQLYKLLIKPQKNVML